LKTNPANIAKQFTLLSSGLPVFYTSNGINNSTPVLPGVAGVYYYTLSQIVNSIESDTAGFKVTMLNLNDVIHLQKLVDSGKLQVNSTFNYPFTFIVSNLTKYPFANVVVTDNLQNSVPLSSEFSIVNKNALGGLVSNVNFDGKIDIAVTAAQSKLAGFAKDTATFIMNLVPKGYAGTLSNIAYVNANTIWGPVTIQSSNTARLGEIAKNATTYFVRDLKVYIPEGFSPNHDGVHDNFVIIKPYGVTLDLQVFNRWGNVVYTNPNYQNDWDGKGTGNFAGQDLVDGGYYYSLRAVDETGKVQLFKGSVIIQR
jgi:gliding motility-associated-like protein